MMDADVYELPEFRYLLTYGTHEFLEGEIRLPVACNLAQALTAILNKHNFEVVSANDGAGSCMNEMYNQFTARQDMLHITCHGGDPRDDSTAYSLGVADGLIVPVQLDAFALHFHLRAHNESSIGPLNDYRKRLNLFYAHYNPTKLCAIDGMLYDARGFEEELIQALIAQYGPEPGEGGDVRFRDRLIAFYHHYNAGKLSEVDNILAEYRGSEEQLFAALCGKYGPEPIIMGSELGSDESYTFTTDSQSKPARDLHPLAVPLMPLFEPLPEAELPPPVPELQYDVRFWDNFVNQMPSEDEEDYGVGLDCNQDLLRQFIRSFPILFPHIITLTCPFKEEVFKGSNEFWQYIVARSEGQEAAVARAAAAGGEHIVRAVSSLDRQAACVMTRREWQSLVEDWERAHNLVRRVNVGSVALDGVPAISGLNADADTDPGPPPVLDTKAIQTVCDGATQTAEAAAARADPPPPEARSLSPHRQAPSPAFEIIAEQPRAPLPVAPPAGRRTLIDAGSLPVAWPIDQLPFQPPEAPTPPPGDMQQPEPWLLEAVHATPRRPAPQPARTSGTQTSGWVPPAQRRGAEVEPAAAPHVTPRRDPVFHATPRRDAVVPAALHSTPRRDPAAASPAPRSLQSLGSPVQPPSTSTGREPPSPYDVVLPVTPVHPPPQPPHRPEPRRQPAQRRRQRSAAAEEYWSAFLDEMRQLTA